MVCIKKKNRNNMHENPESFSLWIVGLFPPSLPFFFSPFLYLPSPPFPFVNLHICLVTFSRFIPLFHLQNQFGVNCIQIYVGHNVCKLSCAFLRIQLNIRCLILLLNPKHYLSVKICLRNYLNKYCTNVQRRRWWMNLVLYIYTPLNAY